MRGTQAHHALRWLSTRFAWLRGVAGLRGTASQPDGVLFLTIWHEWVSHHRVVPFSVDAPVHGPRNLRSERSHETLMVLECAEALLALPNALGVVVPRVRHSPLAFPIAAPWKLVSLARAIAMVELLAQLDHAEGERPLAHIRIHSLEDVIVRPIPL